MLIVSTFFTSVSAATAPTGFTKTSDVVYKKDGNKIYNWGVREEKCIFLSPNAVSFYTGNNTFDKLSALKGGTTQSNAPSSALYSALKSFMTSKHTNINSYNDNKNYSKYTDSEKNFANGKISSFYSGKLIGPSWDGNWNREHTWPNSKGLGGSDENDIMMIRPTSISENSSRGNTAYGQSSGYYNPNSESNGNHDLRGDVARITLYVYVRWGNTSKMWGKSGVMESLTVLLKWMQEDPVDTWEMGRNDSVQSLTGTRNVFVDYPEFAWLLFGKSVPTNMTTPSGENKGMGGSNQGGNKDDENQDNGNQDNGNQDNDDKNDTTSNGSSDRVDEDNRPADDSTSNEEGSQGGIDNKPQNEGKPFDPNNLGGQYVEVGGNNGGLETWVWVLIISGSVVAVAAITVVTIIVIKKKKVK